MGLLVASLINAVLPRPVGLGGRPCLGGPAVVPNSILFHMTDLIELRETSKSWDIFYNLGRAGMFSGVSQWKWVVEYIRTQLLTDFYL